MRRLAILFLVLSIFALPVAGAEAVTFGVTSTADSNSGTCTPGACTLRQAVEAANNSSGPDEVSLPDGEYSLTFGQLPIFDDLTISGGGAGSVAIVSDGSSRVIALGSNAYSLTIKGVRISGGRVKGTGGSQAGGGAIYNAGDLRLEEVVVSGNLVEPADASGTSPRGGGIYNAGNLVIVGSTIEQNIATGRPFNGGIPSGGGVFNEGSVEIADSRFLDNETQTAVGGIPQGGGLFSEGTSAEQAAATVTRSLFEGNVAVGEGGTIPSGGAIGAGQGDLTVRESTIRGNEAIAGTGGISEGGGIYVWSGDFRLAESLVVGNRSESAGSADAGGIVVFGTPDDVQSIVNSTVVDNEVTGASARGGGLMHLSSTKGTLEVVNSTFAGNSADRHGGNVLDVSQSGKGATLLRNSIVAAGSAPENGANCEGPVESAGHNIDSRDECNFKSAGDKVNTDPLLGPLADNGGPTQTMALLAGSPALDAAGAPCPPTDQRGVPRPQGPACDIGAFEVQVPAPPPTAASGQAKLRFLSKRVAIALKTGKGRLRVSCLNVAGDLCSVRLRLFAPPTKSSKASASKRTKIGTVTGTIDGGKTGALRVKLNKRGRALLAASPNAKLRVRAPGISRNRASEPVSIKTKLLLKPKGVRPPR